MNNPLAASTNCYHGYSLEEALNGIAQAGFRHVELSAVRGWTEHVSPDADETTVDELKVTLKEKGLDVVSLSGHSDLTTPEGVRLFRKNIQLASRFGANVINGAIGGDEGVSAEDVEALFRAIGQLADEALDVGLTIALEVHGPVMNSGRAAAKVIERIGRENVRINYDTGNAVYYGGARPEEDIRHALPYMAHMHIKDKRGGAGIWDFPAIGYGEIDWARVLGACEEAGFAGPCSIELEFQGEPWPPTAEVDEAVAASFEFLRAYFS